MSEKPKVEDLTFEEKMVDYAWRAVPLEGFEQLEVSTNGGIRTVVGERPVDVDADGYVSGLKSRMLLVKLILLTWEGQPEVVHLDGDSSNLHYLNLAWMSPESARQTSSRYLSTVPNRALNVKQVRQILRLKETRTARDISVQFKVSKWTIYAIWQGRVWKDEYRRWQKEQTGVV